MSRPHLPRLALLVCLTGVLLLPACCNLPMSALAGNGPPVPGPLSSGMTPPLALAPAMRWPNEPRTWTDEAGGAAAKSPTPPALVPTSHHEGDAFLPAVPKEVVVDIDAVLRLVRERNAQILAARERVNEAQAAFEAAVNSCVPELLRKDAFKRANAEAALWQRRAELAKVQNEVLQDAANTYFDGLTARRGEAVAHELEKYEESLLQETRDLVQKGQNQLQALVETVEAALSGRRQYISRVHQQGGAAAAKLAYLLGMGDGVPVPANPTPAPIDLVDAAVPVEILVRQAQDGGPGVRELQGLAAAIQNGIAQADCARWICDRTGAALVCGHLHVAQSKLQQANLALVDLRGKLQAGVEDARSGIFSGREQITRASATIQHAGETYRLTDLRRRKELLSERIARNTYGAVLTAIRQLSQAHANYLSAVNDYNKAEVRLMLLIGTLGDLPPHGH